MSPDISLTRIALLALSLVVDPAGGYAQPPARVAGPTMQAHEITIDNFTFAPATLTVRAGVEVTWVNQDDMPHTVVSADKAFASQAMDTGEKFSFTFTKPGTYRYYCSIHPKMTGAVIVH